MYLIYYILAKYVIYFNSESVFTTFTLQSHVNSRYLTINNINIVIYFNIIIIEHTVAKIYSNIYYLQQIKSLNWNQLFYKRNLNRAL